MLNTSEVLQHAAIAKTAVAGADSATKNRALGEMSSALTDMSDKILEANAADVEASCLKIGEVMTDRLRLTKERIASMAKGIDALRSLPDPNGRVLSENIRPNGLLIRKISVPMGVIGIIYESRPNVTSDAASLAIKSSSACVLRSGKEAFRSSKAIADAMKQGLCAAGLPADAVMLVEDTSRDSALQMMRARGYIDLLIPRGGAGLISACVENALVPCIQTGTGICHIYVEKSADMNMALDIIENAKTSRPSVCNACEVVLVDRAIAGNFLPLMKKRLADERAASGLAPVELICDSEALGIIGGTPAGAGDFDREFLDYKLACHVVSDCREAVEHIRLHSTHHSEAIVSRDPEITDLFTRNVDSAAVYVNASTRFTDGSEFGLGCEMGISTQKMHARGPLGLEELMSYKYVVLGNGQVR